MGKTKRDISGAAEASFHKHYASIWGEERWHTSLYPALAAPNRYAALINRYADGSSSALGVDEDDLETLRLPDSTAHALQGTSGIIAKIRTLEGANRLAETSTQSLDFPDPSAYTLNDSKPLLFAHWNLDAASLLAAHLMNVKAGENVLDLCAAPGGKSIALAQSMFPACYASVVSQQQTRSVEQAGVLHSNESDPVRFKLLSKNLREYLPLSLDQAGKLVVMNQDATEQLAYRKFPCPQGYDKVLVDAPCSSERHIIHTHMKRSSQARSSASDLSSWRAGSSKRLQETQARLLMTGLKAAKIGGTVVYATCSIEPGENDGVIEKVRSMLEKEHAKQMIDWSFSVGFEGGKGDQVLETELETHWAERTKHGWIVLPDHVAGGRWGPLFFAVLTKAHEGI